AAFNRFRGIDQIPPNQIPARVVVMGLQFPRPFAALGFKTSEWRRRRTAASSRKIRKPLLGEIAVAIFFVDAEAIESTNAIDADECAKDVRLFLIDIDELGKFAFNVIDGLAESGDRETRRKLAVALEIGGAGHPIETGSFRSASLGTAWRAIAKYSRSSSMPMECKRRAAHAAMVEPAPMKGSRMMPLAQGKAA